MVQASITSIPASVAHEAKVGFSAPGFNMMRFGFAETISSISGVDRESRR